MTNTSGSSLFLAVVLASALLVWSAVANLLIGERLYVGRNLALVVVLLVAARRAGLGWHDLGLRRADLAAGLRWGGTAACVVAIAIGIGVLLRDVIPFVGALLADQRAGLPRRELVWGALVRIPLGTAVFEEIAFRGVLLALLLRASSPAGAVLWSSVVFGLWHIPPAMVTLRLNGVAVASTSGAGSLAAAVAVTTFAGVMFAALRLVSGSLLAPVLAHWATNGIGLVAAWATGGASERSP